MKVRALIITLLFLASAMVVIMDSDHTGSAQMLLSHDDPVLDDSPIQDDYEFEVLGGEYAVVGVRPDAGNNNDLEIYTDNSYNIMIDSSTFGGNTVDFVSLYKNAWTGPPNRGAKVTLGPRDFVIEMENQIDSHSVFDFWGGSMDEMPGNPVLDVGPSGSWDDTYVSHPSVIYANGMYRMWYTGNTGDNYFKIGYATSPDGLTWTKYGGNPVLDIDPGQWDSHRAYSPTVLYASGSYHMWYVGYDNSGSFNVKIGYATSPDGITWARSPSNPVLNLGGGGEWDSQRVYAPFVRFDGGMFHMWYSGYNGASYRIGYATSADGESWARHPSNPILSPGSGGTWDDSRVFGSSLVYDGSTYFMAYIGQDGSKYRIGYASSADGVNWHKSPANPVVDLGPATSWDDFHVHSPSILEDGGKVAMWYAGEDGSKTRIGYATIPEIDNWEKYSGNPVLDIGPGGQWDDEHVRSPSVIFDGSIYHMWYCGYRNFEWKIGYANSTDGINWNKYSSNPVMSLGSSGSWDDKQVLQPVVLYNGGIYHMWFSGDDGTTTRRIGYANSTDGLTWNKYSGNPIINVGTSGLWDDESIYPRTVIKDGSTYKMWYHAQDGTNQRIGYATSPDGLSWTKYPGNPIMDLGPSGSWEDTNVFKPTILYDGSIYQMWYGGGDSSVSRTGYATSSDGINWQRYPGNPILDVGSPGSFDDVHTTPCSIYYDGITYHFWYTSYDGSTYRIGYANLPWKKQTQFNEVLDAYEITGFIGGAEYTIDLNVPVTADLDMFLFDTSGGRGDAFATSIGTGFGLDESMTFTAPISGDYLLVITNEDGGYGAYTVSMVGTPPMIINVDAQPNPQEVYGAVNITADVTDDQQLWGIWINISNPSGFSIGNFTMTNVSGFDNFWYEQTYDLLGQYSFVIWANDTTNIWSLRLGNFIIQDTTPPVIWDINSFPDPQEVYGFVRTSAAISDNFLLDGSWIEIYDPTSALVGNFTLQHDTIFDRWYYEQEYDLLGEYSFTIWAKDSVDNWNSESGTFNLEDTTPPLIEDVTASPEPQDVFGDVNVSVSVSDNFEVDEAWYELSDSDGNLVGNFTMDYDPISDKYYTEVTCNIIGDYSFIIWTNDTSNNWASSSGSFLVEDNEAPLILNANAAPDPQEVFGTVEISANVTDNYELSNVWVEVRNPQGTLIANVPMEHSVIDGGYYWNQSYDIIGTHTFIIRANDTSDNLAFVTGTFLIRDTTPPVISNLDVEPSLQKLKDPLDISCSVSDNYELDVQIIEIKNPDGIVIDNISTKYDSIFEEFHLNQSYNSSGVYTFTIRVNDTSNNWASTTGSFEIEEEEEPDEYNWKPLIALIFTLILLIVGIVIVLSHPMKFTGELGRDRTYSFFAGVLPFVVAEAITGIVSFFTGLLAVPPLFGIGMIVDLAILIIGIICGIVIYVKGVPADSYGVEEPQPPQTETQSGPQSPPKTFHLDGSPRPPESPSPESPPETTPKEPGEDTPPPDPEPEEEPPETPPIPPEDEPPATPPQPPFESIPPPISPPPFE
jgi:predicted GH43/DUF377 family glycosyl hydrolase